MRELKKHLLQLANEHNVCNDGIMALESAKTKESLMTLILLNYEYCCKHKLNFDEIGFTSYLPKFAKTESINVLLALAKCPLTDTKTLLKLADSQYFGVKLNVAKNLSSSNIVLTKLLMEPNIDIDILEQVAKNPNLSVETMLSLSSHENIQVCVCLAMNTNCPKSLLKVLAKHKNVKVSREAIQNPNIDLETLEVYSHKYFRQYVTNNPKCPQYIRERLSKDNRVDIRLMVAKSKFTPNYILDSMSKNSLLEKIYIYDNPNTTSQTKSFVANWIGK